ncbi:MAG: isochorismatase family protein [Isosphaeraceae bacterium]
MPAFRILATALLAALAYQYVPTAEAGPPSGTRVYENKLTPIRDPKPILADHPRFVEPITETARFEAPTLVDDPGADLDVRAWRFSYNARGIVEVPNRLRLDRTAVIVVHPWGVDDGQGWRTPEPAGAAFQCTPPKNAIVLDHGKQVIDPLLKALRGKVALVAYSLPGKEDPIRKKLYRSIHGKPAEGDRAEGQRLLEAKLNAFSYQGGSLPTSIAVSEETPTLAYFKSFPGLDASAKYDPAGFWELPIPVMKTIEVARDDLVIYDAEGYPLLRDYLKAQGIRHVLLAGYNTDMCVCLTTAGYKNLSQDFDVFLVGDATIATFPGNPSPRFATNASVSFAALNLFITQSSWIRPARR